MSTLLLMKSSWISERYLRDIENVITHHTRIDTSIGVLGSSDVVGQEEDEIAGGQGEFAGEVVVGRDADIPGNDVVSLGFQEGMQGLADHTGGAEN